ALPAPQTTDASDTGLVQTSINFSPGAQNYLSVTPSGSQLTVGLITSTLPLGPLTATIGLRSGSGAVGTLTVIVNVSATFSKVTAGGAYTCGLTTVETVYCWGDNAYGQLGIGTIGGQYLVPQPILSPGVAIIDVTAGYLHACAITSQFTVYCWGWNQFGQLGIGTSGGTVPTPTVMPSFQAAQVALGLYHTCAVLYPLSPPSGNTVSCWGSNSYGQLGIDTQDTVAHPTPETTDFTFASVTAGVYHTCAIQNF